MAPNSIRARALLVSLLLVMAGACSSGGGPTRGAQPSATSQSDTTIESSDGGLRVVIPPGATDRVSEITVDALEKLPKGLGTGKGTAYELKPDGLTFTQPITIERRIDAAERGVDLSRGTPTVALFSRAKGRRKWSPLEDLAVEVQDGVIVASGTTTHFSTLLAINTGVTVALDPGEVNSRPPYKWVARATVEKSGPLPTFLDDLSPSATGIVISSGGTTRTSSPASGQSNFRCDTHGNGTYTLTLTLREDVSDVGRFLLAPDPLVFKVPVTGPAACGERSPSGPFVGGTVEVQHQEFEDYFPSSALFSMCFTPDTEGHLSLEVDGMNDGETITVPIKDGRVEIRGGLRSYGPLHIQKVKIELANGGVIDLTGEVRDYFGELDVTAQEGVIAGYRADCP